MNQARPPRWRRAAGFAAAVLFLLLSVVSCGMGGTARPAAGDITLSDTDTQVVGSDVARHSTPTPRPRRTPAATPTRAPPARIDGLPVIYVDQLPREARDTLRLIDRGGPFPYSKDGSVFQNREGLLPDRPRGYYREYTVITPGENDRGARRIVGGERGELYYTADHYDSFSRIMAR